MNDAPEPLSPFRLLADPARYRPCDWSLTQDAAARAYWVEFFKRHFRTILGLGIEAATRRGADRADMRRRADAAGTALDARLDAFAASPASFGEVTMLTLDGWRDAVLREHAFGDPFVDLKDRENEAMLPLLPRICREIDALRGADQLRAVIEGVFAGNIFDMGAQATAERFLHGGPDFHDVRRRLPARPWLIDDYDALEARLLDGPPHRKAVFFIDNAGSDFLLGALPMMRWMALRGTRVALVANERPTLNDMTIHDVRRWWGRVVDAEPSLASLGIEPVSSGTGEPLIDLGGVSQDLNRAAAGADLVVLEGMGRGVESNLDAAFVCDALNLAMLKDGLIAARLGGRVFDVVCRFRRGGAAR